MKPVIAARPGKKTATRREAVNGQFLIHHICAQVSSLVQAKAYTVTDRARPQSIVPRQNQPAEPGAELGVGEQSQGVRSFLRRSWRSIQAVGSGWNSSFRQMPIWEPLTLK